MTCRLCRAGMAMKRRAVPVLLFAGIAAIALAVANVAWIPDAGAATGSSAPAASEVLAKLARQARQYRHEVEATAKRREAAARSELAKQQKLVAQASAHRNALKARGDALQKQFNANGAQIKKLSELLAQRQGNMGELFGVVRVVSAEAAKELQNSLLATQFKPKPGQEAEWQFLKKLSGAESLPSIAKLQRLWFALLREMIAGGNVVRYRTGVLQLDQQGQLTGKAVSTEVVRVGPFTAVTAKGRYLGYLSSVQSLAELDGRLPGHFRDTAYALAHKGPGSGYTSAVVDVARGGLLRRTLSQPSWLERIQLGQAVGYVIIAVGIIGLLMAIFQYIYLLRTRLAIRAQLGDPSRPKPNNPLGRLELALRDDDKGGQKSESTELVALHLDDTVRREVLKLDRFQAFIRLAIAVGPLLGLIGTVTGMIITFHAIVASGGGDPTVMATGIGQAMIATVLGLGVAVPLLFLNMGLRAFSGSITQMLDERSNTLLAERLKGDVKHAT